MAGDVARDQIFEVGATYWPSASGVYWWDHFSPSEVKREFELASEHLLRRLIVRLPWYEVQPFDERVSASTLRSLEQVLDLAHGFDLTLTVTLLPVGWAGLAWLPLWLLNPLAEGARPVVTGHGISRRLARPLFSDARAKNAAVRQIREVVGEFDRHPALGAWVLGDRLAVAGAPATSAVYGSWLTTVTEAFRAVGSIRPVRTGISAQDLVQSPAIDVASAAASGLEVQVAADWVAAWGHSGPVWSGFLAAYTKTLSETRVFITELTAPDGARNVSSSIEAVYEAGGAGVAAPAVFNYDAALSNVPGFRQQPERLSEGLMTGRGALTSSGMGWGEWLVAPPAVRSSAVPVAAPDPEERGRQPEGTARDFYRRWTS